MNKVTIIFHNNTEEVIECYDVGETRSYTMFFGEDDRPFRMVKTDEIVEIFIEYPKNSGTLQIDFTPDDREMH